MNDDIWINCATFGVIPTHVLIRHVQGLRPAWVSKVSVVFAIDLAAVKEGLEVHGEPMTYRALIDILNEQVAISRQELGRGRVNTGLNVAHVPRVSLSDNSLRLQ
jgi:hypothetical protein